MKWTTVKAVVYIAEDMRVMEGTCTCTTRFDGTNAHCAFKPQEVKTVQRGLALSACWVHRYGRDAWFNIFKNVMRLLKYTAH